MSPQHQATQASAAQGSFTRRFIKSLLTLSLLMLIPLILVGLIFGKVAASAYPLGVMAGLFVCLGDGRETAVKLAPMLLLGTAASAATAGSWWWVVTLAVIGGLVGWLATQGIAVGVVAIAIAVTAAQAQTGLADTFVYLGFVMTGYALGVMIAKRAGAAESSAHEPLSRLSPARAAVVSASALAGAAAIAVSTNWGHAFWYPMSFLVLLGFVVREDRGGIRMVGYRIVGTLLGIALLVPITSQIPGPARYVAVICLIAAGLAVSSDRYWLGTAAITAGVVVFSSGNEDPFQVGHQRFMAVVVAAGLLGLVLAGLRWVTVSERTAEASG